MSQAVLDALTARFSDQIVETGSHDDLVARQEAYFRLLN